MSARKEHCQPHAMEETNQYHREKYKTNSVARTQRERDIEEWIKGQLMNQNV